MRRLLPALLLVCGLSIPGVAAAQTTPADGTTERDQIVLSGDVSVPPGRAVGEVVVVAGSVDVEGVVRGDVVVVRGDVRVAGQVGGTVVVVDGAVSVEPSGQVGEDVLAGGEIVIAPGAMVRGETRPAYRLSLASALEGLGNLLAAASVAFSSLLLGLVLLAFAPRGADRTAEAIRTAPAAVLLWGLALWILMPVLALLAVASVVGIPAGLALLLGLGLVAALGYTLGVWTIGRWIVPSPRSRLGAYLAGWGVGSVLGLVPFLHVAWWSVAAVVGIGGAAVAARHEGPPAPGQEVPGDPAEGRG